MNFLKKFKFRYKTNKHSKQPPPSVLMLENNGSIDLSSGDLSPKVANPMYTGSLREKDVIEPDKTTQEGDCMYLLAKHVDTDSDSESPSPNHNESATVDSKGLPINTKKIAIVSPTYQNMGSEEKSVEAKQSDENLYQNVNNDDKSKTNSQNENIYQNMETGEMISTDATEKTDSSCVDENLYQNVEPPILEKKCEENIETELDSLDALVYEPIEKPAPRPAKAKPQRPPPPNFAKRSMYAADRVNAARTVAEYLNIQSANIGKPRLDSPKLFRKTLDVLNVACVTPHNSPRLTKKSTGSVDVDDQDEYFDMSSCNITESPETDDDYIPMTLDDTFPIELEPK